MKNDVILMKKMIAIMNNIEKEIREINRKLDSTGSVR
jgi:hypothetical protein